MAAAAREDGELRAATTRKAMGRVQATGEMRGVYMPVELTGSFLRLVFFAKGFDLSFLWV